jgi:hypothetical protein
VIASVLVFAPQESVKYLTLHPARRAELVALLGRIDDALQIAPTRGSWHRIEKSISKTSPHLQIDTSFLAETRLSNR